MYWIFRIYSHDKTCWEQHAHNMVLNGLKSQISKKANLSHICKTLKLLIQKQNKLNSYTQKWIQSLNCYMGQH
jgi:hypothetical protein